MRILINPIFFFFIESENRMWIMYVTRDTLHCASKKNVFPRQFGIYRELIELQ